MGTPSIAAVVASKDDDFAQWTTSLRIQSPDDETRKSNERIVDLEDMVVEHNGVSESQFDMVRGREIPAIESDSQAV